LIIYFPILFLYFLPFFHSTTSFWSSPGFAPTKCTHILACIISACAFQIQIPNQELEPSRLCPYQSWQSLPVHHPSTHPGQPNYIKTRRFADPLTWSTSSALMYSAQPNGADSATINPAALNTGMLPPTFLCFQAFFCLEQIK